MAPRPFAASAALALAAVAAAAPACNLTGAWTSVNDANPIKIVMAADYSFLATAKGWEQPTMGGTYTPSNGAITFSCCGGQTGSIDATCDLIKFLDSNNDAWARGSGESGAITTPMYSVGMGYAPGKGASLNSFSFFGAGAMTTNFALSAAGATAGGTLLLPAAAGRSGTGAISATCGAGCVLTSSPTNVTLSGLTLGTQATETWSLLQINASAFEWRVARTYAAGATSLAVDRFAFSYSTTGGQPIHSEQIPGFVDLRMFLNDSSTGGFALGNGAYEFLAPAASEFVRFTPTGTLFVVNGAVTVNGVAQPDIFFSFAKPFSDGTTVRGGEGGCLFT